MIIQAMPYPVSGSSWGAAITIASGKVASNLTNYPLYVDLADMPSSFWANTNGEDIRAFVGGTQIACDIVWCDPLTQTGALFVRVPTVSSASSTVIDLQGSGTDSLPAVTDTYGRNAVWSDYESVFLMGITATDDRTGKSAAGIGGDPDFFEKTATSSTDTNSHQGICWDGAYYYTTDANAIYKWDATWTLVASNIDPISAAAVGGSPAVNHCGDPDVHSGRLYIPLECYPASGGLYNAHIAVFDATDLSFIEAFDISAQGHEAASNAYCDKDGLLYVVDYDANNSTIFKYDPADGSYIGTLSTSVPIPQRQGITWWRGYFWVSGDQYDETARVTYDGTATTNEFFDLAGGIGFGSDVTGGNYEGIGHSDSALLQAIDPGATERVETWEPLRMPLGAQGGWQKSETGLAYLLAQARGSYTTFTLGVTMNLTSKPARNQAGVSYVKSSAAASTNTRVGVTYHNATSRLAIWDLNNGWLDSTVNPPLGTSYRVHGVYNGTTNRKIYVNGALGNTGTAIVAVPSGLNTIYIGAEDADKNETLSGKAGFVYLRPSALSAAWIAAEQSNLNAPGSFYSIA